MSNYYEILGVSAQATDQEIKRAYRRLARTFHPDVAGPDGEEKFKEVTHAYEILSDPQKRQLYDLGGEDALNSGGGFSSAFGDSLSEAFSAFFGGGFARRQPASRSRRGSDQIVRVEIELGELVWGVEKVVAVETAVACQVCEGSCCRPGTQPRMCETCKGSGSVDRVVRSMIGQIVSQQPCAVCQGFGTVITDPCQECAGEGRVRTRKQHTVNIPAGIESGMRLRVPGEGEAGVAGGPSGDLYIEVVEIPHPVFQRVHDDLHCILRVNMTAAALGTELELDTFDGEKLVEIPAGSQPGQEVILKNLGVKHLHSSGRGNIIAQLQVEIPKHLNKEQQQALRHFADLNPDLNPQVEVVKAKEGFFSKLKDVFS